MLDPGVDRGPRDELGGYLVAAAVISGAAFGLLLLRMASGGIDRNATILLILSILAVVSLVAVQWFVVRRSESPDEELRPTGRVLHAVVMLQAAGHDILGSVAGELVPGVWTALVLVIYGLLVQEPRRVHRAIALAALGLVALGSLTYGLIAGGGPVHLFQYTIAAVLPTAAALILVWLGAREEHEDDDDALSTRRIGSYELIEPLGQGGMGEVWRARHELLTREVAVKLVRRDRMSELIAVGAMPEAAEQMRRRFEREARLTAQLSSPHTIRIFDYGTSRDAVFYYVMELLDGLDLHTLVGRYGPQPEERVRYIMLQACDSLGEAHARGLVHRDVKPANVFVCAAGMTFDHVKILDFGLVLRPNPEQASRTQLPSSASPASDPQTIEGRLTTAGIVQGTPAYMSPEQVEGELTLDGRTDLYALGCVGYFLLTGTDPYPGSSPLKQMIAHLQQSFEDPNDRLGRDAVSPQFVALIRRLMAKDPAERFQDTEELASALHGLRLPRLWGQPEARRWYLEHLVGRGLVHGAPLARSGETFGARPERAQTLPQSSASSA